MLYVPTRYVTMCTKIVIRLQTGQGRIPPPHKKIELIVFEHAVRTNMLRYVY